MNIDLSTIDWSRFGTVALASVGFAAFVVIAFSFGVRFLTDAQHLVGSGKKKTETDRELLLRIVSYALFAISAVAVAWAVIWMFQVMYTPAK